MPLRANRVLNFCYLLQVVNNIRNHSSYCTDTHLMLNIKNLIMLFAHTLQVIICCLVTACNIIFVLISRLDIEISLLTVLLCECCMSETGSNWRHETKAYLSNFIYTFSSIPLELWVHCESTTWVVTRS